MWKANAKTHFMFTDNLSYCLRLRFASKTHRSRCVAISHRFDHEDRTSHKTDNKQKSKSLTRVFTIASKSLRKRKTFHHRDLKEFSAFKFETKKKFLQFSSRLNVLKIIYIYKSFVRLSWKCHFASFSRSHNFLFVFLRFLLFILFCAFGEKAPRANT